VEYPVLSEAEIIINSSGRMNGRKSPCSSDIPTGQLVDDKISDIVRMTVATCRIVLESDGCPLDFQVKMQDKVLRMLGVKERRS
jgi:hypothetical protein